MDVETIIVKIIIPVVTFLAGLASSIIAAVKKAKEAKAAKKEAEEAKTEAERLAAQEEYQAKLHELRDIARNAIAEAEKTFKTVNDAMKAQTGNGCGTVKKKVVLSDMQNACNSLGIAFDRDYWDSEIEAMVNMTKNVNSENATTEAKGA